MKKRISILGSTGSIGCSAVSLLLNDLKGVFEVDALSFHQNAELAVKQAVLLGAKELVATSIEGYKAALHLCSEIPNLVLKFGEGALEEVCKNSKTEVILVAIVGLIGLKPTLDSILKEESRIVALANKEAIICGWHLIKQKLISSKTKVIPVDSEHNSLSRLLQIFNRDIIKSVFITASGGPFLGKPFSSLNDVTSSEVLKHPIWNMGSKISVDSATMANKSLELIEACLLFDLEEHQIDVFVAKNSILHAGVHLVDRSSIWFLSNPDMKLHIAHAILNGEISSLNLLPVNPAKQINSLEFEELKESEFPIFFIGKEVAKSKDIGRAISFNVLNEIAVKKFLMGKIKYTEILNIISDNLGHNLHNFQFKNLEEIQSFSEDLSNKIKI